MGITDKFSQLATQVQDGVKTSSMSLLAVFAKVITAFMVGLTFALIGQQMMSYGTFSFMFVMVVIMGILWKIMSAWAIGSVLLFDLFCVLVALLLRLYIQVAP